MRLSLFMKFWEIFTFASERSPHSDSVEKSQEFYVQVAKNIISFDTQEQVHRRNLERARQRTNYVIEFEKELTSYISQSTVFDYIAKEEIPVVVRVYDNDCNHYEWKKYHPTLNPVVNVVYDIAVFVENVPIGSVSVEVDKSIKPRPAFVIGNVYNLSPEKYSGVGTLLLKEIVTNIIWSAKQFQIPAQKFQKSRKNKRKKRRIWYEWKQKLDIVLYSVFEAMPFYAKSGFILADPGQLISYEPLAPDENLVPDLKKIEAFNSTNPETDTRSFFYYKKFLNSINVTTNSQGIMKRFRRGEPNEDDWSRLLIWRATQRAEPAYVSVRLDYEALKQKYPHLLKKNLLNMDHFYRRADIVLRREQLSLQNNRPLRQGYHGSIKMIIDTYAFLDTHGLLSRNPSRILSLG